MKKLALLCVMGMFLAIPFAEAGKSYSGRSSSGASRSYSGRSSSGSSRSSFGSSSSSRSYGGSSRSSSSSSRSYGSSSGSSSRSYGGSSSRSSSGSLFGGSHSSSTPSTPSRSYSGSSTTRPSYSGSTTKPTAPIGKSYSGSTTTPNHSYSGSATRPATGKTYSGSRPSSPVVTSPSGKTYSGSKPATSPITPSGKTYAGSTTQTVPNTSKKGATTFNSALSDSAKKQESKVKYQVANPVPVITPAAQPRSTYTTSKGTQRPITANSPQVQTVRRTITHERYVTYDNRASGFYGSYYGNPHPYNDFFSPFLMGYMFSSAVNADQRAYWAYHHRNDMDDYRYNEMLSRDADLSRRLRELETQGIVRDPNYVLPQMQDNPDLQYDRGFVEAAVNPVVAQQSVPVAQPEASSPVKSGWTFSQVFWTLVIGGMIGYGVWYLFTQVDF